jgi:Protein of unknown function (DUF3892)
MCVEIRYVTKENGEIASLGGIDRFIEREQPWGLTQAAVIRLIESGKWSFYVNRKAAWETPDRVGVFVERRNGQKYLRATEDGQPEDPLMNLPPQDPVLTDRMPDGLSSGLPSARTPRLQRAANEPAVPKRLGVFTSRGGPQPIDHLGPYALLPARTIFVRFVGPFSYRYEVRVNGESPLHEAPPETTELSGPLERAGWFALTHIGHLGAFDPAAPVQIDRDFTVYEMRVRLPEELVNSEQVSIQVAQLSLNPNCTAPGNKSDALDLELRRFTGAMKTDARRVF